jgi:hypothetical protein
MNEAKISVEEQAKKHNLDVKYVEAKLHVEETVSGVISGVEAGVAASTEEEEKLDSNGGSSNNEEKQQRRRRRRRRRKKKKKQK